MVLKWLLLTSQGQLGRLVEVDETRLGHLQDDRIDECET